MRTTLGSCYYRVIMENMENHSPADVNEQERILSSLSDLSKLLTDDMQRGVMDHQTTHHGKDLHLKMVMEKEMATHSSTLAWKIPWMEEPGRLPPMGSRRVGQD